MRVLISLSYDGSRFAGFQQNKGVNTVMSVLMDVFLSLGIEQIPVGSSRTDKGVHANNQTLHVNLPPFWSDLEKLKSILNFKLPNFIFIKSIKHVKNDFHARYWAKSREYRYIFTSIQDVFSSAYQSYHEDFDLDKINEILSIFIGEHDFSNFKKSGSDTKNFVRNISICKAIKYKNKTIIIIRANGFLRSQIRMMISAVLKVYSGKLSLQHLKDQLEKKAIYSRSLCEASGLYLHKIRYDKDIYLL